MFKVGSIKESTAAEVEIRHPVTGDGMGAYVTLLGPEHEVRRALAFSHARKVRAELHRTGKIPVTDPEEEADEATERLVKSLTAWRGICDESGEPIAHSAEAVRKLVSASENAWLRAQLLIAMDERERFIKTSAAS